MELLVGGNTSRCQIFAIFSQKIKRTDLGNKKLPKDFWENKLQPEILESFLEEIRAFTCLRKALSMRLTLKSICHVYDMSVRLKSSQLHYFFFGGGVEGSGTNVC